MPQRNNVLLIDSGVNSSKDINIIDSINYVPYESSSDYLNHGTAIARIISSINRDVNITSIKIIDRAGSTVNNKLAKALMYALTHDIGIINVSLGLPVYSENIQNVINALHSRGVLIIASAGNNISDIYPAQYNHVITVGALNDDNTISSYSAPANIYTYGSVTIGNKTYTGTSFSTAIITGLLSKGGNY